MTLFHFGNCLALSYVPYFMTYKFTGLAEYDVFWKCVQAGAIYLLTQLCKMMALATFFPATDISVGGKTETFLEFLKTSMDFADLFGLYIVITKFAGKGETKFLVAGLGWASAEAMVTRFVPLWVGARGIEFDWKYLQMSFDSNVSLIHHITNATLVWLWSRYDLKKMHLPVVAVLLLFSCYKTLIFDFMLTIGLDPWLVLAVKATGTIIIAMVSMHIYFSLTHCVNS